MPAGRIFSGIQPTGKLHLGNYVGALSLWVSAQAEHEAVFCVADLHALTMPEAVRDGRLYDKVRETAAILLACGIDPARATLFVQSHVTAHAELAWLLSCVTPVGWLERMVQFKSLVAAHESVGTGVLAYPVLQAADILLYRADLVPVGDDQQQHVELTREIARRFHTLFGEVFTLPKAMTRPAGARLMGLDDPNVKMSKSLAEMRTGHAISLIDPPEVIRRAVMRAVTDSGPELRPEEASPGVSNLLTIYHILSGQDRAAVSAEFAGKSYSTLKRSVAELVIATLQPIRTRFLEISGAPELLDEVLARGAEHARRLATPILHRVQQLMGLHK